MLNPSGRKMLGAQPLAVLVEGTLPGRLRGASVPAWPAADASGRRGDAAGAGAGAGDARGRAG